MNLRIALPSLSSCRHGVTGAVLLAVLLTVLVPKANANVVTVFSGPAVTFLDSGNCCSDFGAPFTPADFAAAQTGTPAFVLASTPFWFPPSDIPGAVWIGTNPTAGTGSGDTALYAISFTLPSVSSASLSLNYGVDNSLGSSNAGIYINFSALPGSTGIGDFSSVHNYSDSTIAPLLTSGTNWLYIDAVNFGGPAGLIFSATIDYTPNNSVPEPSTFRPLAALLALIGIGLRRWRTGGIA